jgi:nucleoside-diphosphate-sugar epimerase
VTLVVTGASGFVGRHLTREAVARGLTVRAVTRGGERPEIAGVEHVLVTSLEDANALRRACTGADAVVHLAARVHVMREVERDPLEAFRRVNVVGTRSVLDAAVSAGVRRFVFVSSVKVLGEDRDEPYREADLPDPKDPYAVSKLEAERVVAEYATRIETAILRPPLVYGPGVAGNFRRLLGLTDLSRVVPLPLASVRNRRSLVFVGNLAGALLHAVTSAGVVGRAFLVSDDEDLSTADLVRKIGAAGGFRPRLVRCPLPILRSVAALLGRRPELERLTEALRLDVRALRATGWNPPSTVDEGLSSTVSWWREARARGRH